MKRINHLSLDGLKTKTQYLEELQAMYQNVPFRTIKRLEKEIFNESELKQKLEKLNQE